jgi:hypothetical protein
MMKKAVIHDRLTRDNKRFVYQITKHSLELNTYF